MIYNRTPIENVQPFTYCAAGDTALFDTLRRRIDYVKNAQKLEGEPTNTLCIIMTDGKNNVGITSETKIRQIIKERKDAGWKFIFLGALKEELKVQKYAETLGIPSHYAQLYTAEHTFTNFLAIDQIIEDLHTSGTINPYWNDIIKKTMTSEIEEQTGKQYKIGQKEN